MARRLTKGGYDSTRNLDKPYRPERYGDNGRLYPATGFGILSTFGVRAKQFGPKKGKKRSVKRKKTALVWSTDQIVRSHERQIEHLMRTRRQILMLRAIGDHFGQDKVTGHIQTALAAISVFLNVKLNDQEKAKMYAEDQQTIRSVEGRLKVGNFGSVNERQIRSNIDHALKVIQV